MRPGNALFLLLATASIALLPLASTAPATVPAGGEALPPVDPRLPPLCKKTHFPDVCVDSARSYTHEYPAVDATNLFNILVRAFMDETKVGSGKARAMLEDPKLDEKVANNIKSCLQYYDEAIDFAAEGIEAFISRLLDALETRFSQAIGMLGTCNDGFTEFNVPNPLEGQNSRLMNMAGNCILVGKLTFKNVDE